MNTITLTHNERDANGNIVSIMYRSDDFVNATKMCQDTNRNIRVFYNANNIQVDADDRIQTAGRGGTWMQIPVAIQLAQWISQDYGNKFIELFANAFSDFRRAIRELQQRIEVREDEFAQGREEVDKLNEKSNALEKEIQRLNDELKVVITENERLHHTEGLIQENEKLRQETKEAMDKAAVAIEKYDKEIGYQHEWRDYETNYKTVIQLARDRYKIVLTEPTYKKVEKEMIRKWKEYHKDFNIKFEMKTAWERGKDKVDRRAPLNPEILKPEFPEPPKHFKKVTPRTIYTWHRRDWHLFDELLPLFKDDPPYNPLGCRDVSMYDFENKRLKV